MTKVDLNIALKPPFAKRYDYYIGGEWRAPKAGKYFDNVSPITGQPVCEIARSDASDVEAALDAAHAAKDAWGKTSAAERAQILNKIADRIETNLEKLATAETWDNGKPIREAMAAVSGFGLEAGKPLASSNASRRSRSPATTTGRLIMQYASQNLIPVTLELGGKSPNIFFVDVAAHDDDFFDKAIQGFVMFALNQGEVCTCPSRALIQESIYDKFMERALKRVDAITQGSPLDPNTMIGAHASSEQMEKILSYLDIGKKEGAQILIGGERNILEGQYAGGYYIKPTVFKGSNKMRIFQEEIFGPVVAVTTFKTDEEALSIANDTLYGLGAGVWSRDANRCYHFGRAIQAGRVWTNCYHAYPAHAAFGGYKQSGVGRRTTK